MVLGIGNFYLGTPMDCYEYMKMPFSIFSQKIIDQYDLQSKLRNVHVYEKIRHAVYELPQAEVLTNAKF